VFPWRRAIFQPTTLNPSRQTRREDLFQGEITMAVPDPFHDGNTFQLMQNPRRCNQSCGGVPKALSSSSLRC
jgi:hypothetical protein